MLFLPISVRLISSQPARRERIALLVMLVSAIYLLRFLNYPLSFAYDDEFLHWRGAIDLLTYQHLFHVNPLLRVGPSYPGLEIATNALSCMTGLSIFASATILLGVAGLILTLSLYLFCECLSSSARIASIAVLLYTAAPGFFDQTSFAYESLALPLAVFVVYIVARRSSMPVNQRMGLTLAIWLGIAAVAITHHVTSYALLAFLLLWTAAFLVLRMAASSRRNRTMRILVEPGGAALVGLILVIAWTVCTGGVVVSYLLPALQNAMQQLIQVLAGKGTPHQFFKDQTGFVEPLWERLTAIASVALICLGLPFGLYEIWRRHRDNAGIIAMACAVFAYPATQLAHIASIGAVTDRIAAFLFLAITFVLAIGITKFRLSRISGWAHYAMIMRHAMIIGTIVVIFIGGWITTGLSWYRLPGPYLVAADHRSMNAESVDDAEWMLQSLGPGHRTASDLTNALIMGTYGYQWNVMSAYEKIEIAPLFTTLVLSRPDKKILQVTKTQYIVVDLRLSTALPRLRGYFDAGEPDAGHYTSPIDLAALTKFDGMQNVNRIFDSGNIVIYDVGAIANPPSVTSAPPSLCTPTLVLSSAPKVAEQYTGTLYDITTGKRTGISLTGIQQKQGGICGTLSGIPSNGPFNGTITPSGQIHFVFNPNLGQGSFSFNGFMMADGSLFGTYCRTQNATKTCNDYGLWSVSPAQSG